MSPNGGRFLVAGCTFTDNSADTGGGVFCGSLSNSVEAVSNMVGNAIAFLYDMAEVDLYGAAHNITNLLLELATGPGTLPPPDMSSSPGRPEMMQVPHDMTSWSNTIRHCTANGNTAICGGGFFLFDGSGAVVSNCHVFGNGARGGSVNHVLSDKKYPWCRHFKGEECATIPWPPRQPT